MYHNSKYVFGMLIAFCWGVYFAFNNQTVDALLCFWLSSALRKADTFRDEVIARAVVRMKIAITEEELKRALAQVEENR